MIHADALDCSGPSQPADGASSLFDHQQGLRPQEHACAGRREAGRAREMRVAAGRDSHDRLGVAGAVGVWKKDAQSGADGSGSSRHARRADRAEPTGGSAGETSSLRWMLSTASELDR